MKSKMQKWNLIFMAIFIFIGGLLGQIIIYSVKGEFNFSSVLGFLVGAVILSIINVIRVYLKSDKTPETDERIKSNVVVFYTYSAHIFLGLLFVALSISSFIGIESIPVFYLWIIIIAYLWISGIGAFIVRHR